jgi:transcriptional regulator
MEGLKKQTMNVEEHVLTLKAKGYSMRQIAKMLGISRYRVSCIIRSRANHEKQCTADNQKLGYGALFI